MYASFFGLHEKPFSITPDPRYLFMSERHGEALAHLVYGVTESGGFIQLTGEVGTGKTTLVRTLLANRLPDNADVAVVLNPQQSALEFLQSICEELHVVLPPEKYSAKALIDTLNQHLLTAHASGRRTILVVDEAQNLQPEVLEQVRLLTNLETAKQKLLQIILIGQPELRELLSRNDLRQLAQRITGRYHLEPLTRDETSNYIEHRLRVAGALGEVFDSGAKQEVYRLSQGIPRLINVICDRALLGAYSQESRTVNKRLVTRAASEISGTRPAMIWTHWATPVVGAAAAALIAAGLWAISQRQQATPVIQPTAHTGTIIQRAPAPVPIRRPESEAPESGPTLHEQLLLAAELTESEPALRALFDIWGIDYNAGGGCSQAESAGYACLYQRGSWSSLRLLNRPAVLTLTDTNGGTHQVVLSAIHGDKAELSIAGVTVTHPISDVSEVWFGQFQLLWKPPNGTAMSLRTGSRGPNVIWLRQSLATIDARYRTRPVDSNYFDTELARAVREFQRDNRIDVDGLAGHQTQIVINSLLAADGSPRLLTPRLARD